MIPVLYTKDELTFASNGVGRLVDAISCVVTEELNGVFELEMTYPVNGKYFPLIQSGGIIGVVYNGKLQPFDINKVTTGIDGICTVNASHVSNRVAHSWTYGQKTNVSLTQMMTNLNGSGQAPYAYEFAYSTDISSAGLIYSELIEPAKSVVARLAVAFGGEIEYDVWDVKLLTRRGTDTKIIVSYGKDISDLERELDWSSCWNAIVPYWDDGNSSYFPYTVSTAIQTVPQTPVIPQFINFAEEIDHYPTQQELYDAGVNYMTAYQPWVPFDNTQSTVLEVSDNDPAKGLRIGDTLTVVFTKAGITLESTRVVAVEYNVLLERNNSITVGSPQKEYVAVEGLDNNEARFVTPADLNARLVRYALKTDLNSILSLTTVSKSVTCAANNTKDATLTGTNSGYYPIGIVGVDSQGTGSGSVITKDFYRSASGNGTVSVYVQVRNVGGSSYTGNIVAYVLWRKIQ